MSRDARDARDEHAGGPFRRRTGWRVAAAQAAFALLPPLAAFAHKGFVIAFLLAAAAGARGAGAAALWRRNALLAAGAAALCLWALAALPRAPDPDLARALRHLALIPLGLCWISSLRLLDGAAAERLRRTLTVAVWAAIAAFALQLATGGMATRLWYAETYVRENPLWLPFASGPGGAFADLWRAKEHIDERIAHEAIAAGGVLLLGMVWPAAARLWTDGRRAAAAATAAAAAACIFALPLAAAAAGMLVGAAGFVLALRWPRAAPVAVLAAFAGYAAAAPAVSAHWATIDALRGAWSEPPYTWEHRVGMWSFAANEILAAGAAGRGYDASRAIALDGGLVGDWTESAAPKVSRMESLRMHPHNGVLQIWLELGAPGVAALLLVCAGLGSALLRAPAGPPRAAATAALAAMLTPFLVSFGVWQSWWLSALMLVAGATVVLTPRDRPPRLRSRGGESIPAPRAPRPSLRRPAMTSDLDRLESESLYILREAHSRIGALAMLWSLGKDSNVLVHLARKAFLGRVPFPVAHIDTGRKFPEMYAFRDAYAKEWGLDLVVAGCPPLEEIDPTLPPAARAAARKTAGLKALVAERGYTGLVAGIRRDEEGTRAKERAFSPRGGRAEWDARGQPPEFWGHYNAAPPPGGHVRVHPLLAWTEIDVWRYIDREGVPVVDLYFSRGGKRYRSLGDADITHPVDSAAATAPEIVAELEATRAPERAGRAMDWEAEDSVERLRADGYM